MTGVFIKRGNLDTETNMHRGKTMWRDTSRRHSSTNQGEKPGKDPSLSALRGLLDSDF